MKSVQEAQIVCVCLLSCQLTAIQEEEYDKNYQPTPEEISEYGAFLGMDIEKDKKLMWIAEESLKAPLPPNWKPCKTTDGILYYFNFSTGQSTWTHPCDEYYKKLYESEKEKTRNGNGKKAEHFEPVPPAKNIHRNIESINRKKEKTSIETPSDDNLFHQPRSPPSVPKRGLEDYLLTYDSHRKSFLDSAASSRNSRGSLPNRFENQFDSQNKFDGRFLTLESSPPRRASINSIHSRARQPVVYFNDYNQNEQFQFIGNDSTSESSNLKSKLSKIEEKNSKEQVSSMYSPKSGRRLASKAQKSDMPITSAHSIESDFLTVSYTNESLGAYEKQLKSYESSEIDSFNKEAAKIKEKYEILTHSFEKDRFGDFLFNIGEAIGSSATKKITEIEAAHENKTKSFKVTKELEYQRFVNNTNDMWKQRFEKFENEQKREFEKKCTQLLEEYEAQLEKDLATRKQEAKQKFEKDLDYIDEKYEDLNAKEKKRKHYEALQYMEDLEDNLKLDMKKIKEDFSKRLSLVETEYQDKIDELNAKKTEAERNYEKNIELRYLQIEKDKQEMFKLQIQTMDEKELELKVKREKLRIEEDEVRKLECDVKGFRNTILIEKRNMVDHENESLIEPGQRYGPKIRFNDMQTDNSESNYHDYALSEDIENWDQKSHSALKKSVHMQLLDSQFEKEEIQIKEAQNLLNMQGNSMNVKQKELDELKHKWETDMKDIEVRIGNNFFEAQTLLSVDIVTDKALSPSPIGRLPEQKVFITAQNTSVKNNETAPTSHQRESSTQNNDQVNEGISKIIDILSTKKPYSNQENIPELYNLDQIQQKNSRIPYTTMLTHRNYAPPSFIRNAPVKYNRYIDSNKHRSEGLLREHQQWLKGFTARHSDIIRL